MKIAHENDVQTNFFWNVLGTLNTRKFSGLKKKKKIAVTYLNDIQNVPSLFLTFISDLQMRGMLSL